MQKKEKRIAEFEKLGLGLFIHYGLYSLLGKGEWVLAHSNIDKDEYFALKDSFTAENMDFDRLARSAKEAGFKYITFTARHHDGFSLYDTSGLKGGDGFDSVKSPAKRDLIAEFVGACNKHGLLPMLYHTTIDWRCPLYAEDFNKYLDYLYDSVEILCTRYGKIGGLWFDGNWAKPEDDWQEDKLYSMIRKNQPDAMIINNTGLSKLGETGSPYIDSVTFERGKPSKVNMDKKYLAAEMCDVVCSHWGWAEADVNYKSLKTLIENMVDCRKYNANYLLNIAPKGDGSFSYINLGIMEEIGKWNKVNGEVMSAFGCGEESGGAFLLKGEDCYYLIVKNLTVGGDENVALAFGDGRNVVFSLDERIEDMRWLDNGNPLKFEQAKANVTAQTGNFPYGFDYAVRVAKITIKG